MPFDLGNFDVFPYNSENFTFQSEKSLINLWQSLNFQINAIINKIMIIKNFIRTENAWKNVICIETQKLLLEILSQMTFRHYEFVLYVQYNFYSTNWVSYRKCAWNCHQNKTIMIAYCFRCVSDVLQFESH